MKVLYLLFFIQALFLASCDNEDPPDREQAQDHVWKEQTDTIEKAKAVEGILQESAKEQRRQIQDETE